MNQHTSLKAGGSLIERAAELYGFAPAANPTVPAPKPVQPEQELELAEPAAPQPEPELKRSQPEPRRLPARRVARPTGGAAAIDRAKLRDAGFVVPEEAGGALAEELRLVKRQLLLGTGPGSPIDSAKRRTVLVCSAQPDDGKTFCAINLALSLAGEKEREVLLVDSDFPKPEVLSILGVEGERPGLVDALADPALDPESLIIPTDVGSLSLLPAGRRENDVPELLASERTPQLLERLVAARPNRIIIFDSPPALMASAASALAVHVGQVLMVVRADKTTEADLKEAVSLLSGCGQIGLLLNGTGFAATGRRFGSYYGYGQ